LHNRNDAKQVMLQLMNYKCNKQLIPENQQSKIESLDYGLLLPASPLAFAARQLIVTNEKFEPVVVPLLCVAAECCLAAFEVADIQNAKAIQWAMPDKPIDGHMIAQLPDLDLETCDPFPFVALALSQLTDPKHSIENALVRPGDCVDPSRLVVRVFALSLGADPETAAINEAMAAIARYCPGFKLVQ
jgi:hypothetical protein